MTGESTGSPCADGRRSLGDGPDIELLDPAGGSRHARIKAARHRHG